MTLDERPVALYQRVKSHIRDQIQSGALKPHERVLPEHDLMRQFSASRMTVHRALRELAAEGYVQRLQGVGTFVSQVPVQAELIKIRSIAEEIRERGHTHASKLIWLKEVPATLAVARAFGFEPGAPVFHSLIVHSENGVPIQIEDRYVNPSVAPDYLSIDFSNQTPNEFLVRIAPITQVKHVIEAVSPDKQVCKLLKIAADQPCLRLFRLTWTYGIPGTCAWLTHPGNIYRMVAQFTPT
jgi:GntR family histidine utilization transcriptional repressor